MLNFHFGGLLRRALPSHVIVVRLLPRLRVRQEDVRVAGDGAAEEGHEEVHEAVLLRPVPDQHVLPPRHQQQARSPDWVAEEVGADLGFGGSCWGQVTCGRSFLP
eukprot:14311082-Alexandrium_andersonii.AAC.1